MRIVYTKKTKIILCIFGTIFLLGLLLVFLGYYSAFIDPPEQCGVGNYLEAGKDDCIVGADIGSGVLFFLGLYIAAAGLIAWVATFVSVLITANFKNPRKVKLITFLAVAVLVLLVWHIRVTIPGQKADIKKAEETAGLRAQTKDFVEYSGTPRLSDVTKVSSSVIVSQDGSDKTVILDLHACNPGSAEFTHNNHTARFVFSGIRKSESAYWPHTYECVFYLDYEKPNPKWEGVLNLKCVDEINMWELNRHEFLVQDHGIQFRDYPSGVCTDLRTGSAPPFDL